MNHAGFLDWFLQHEVVFSCAPARSSILGRGERRCRDDRGVERGLRRSARPAQRPAAHGDSVLELLHVPRQKFNRLICSRACILVAAEICWRWSRRAWHAWCTNLSETLYEYIYGRSIYTPDSGSMVSDVRRVRGRLHRSASPEDWTQASAL